MNLNATPIIAALLSFSALTAGAWTAGQPVPAAEKKIESRTKGLKKRISGPSDSKVPLKGEVIPLTLVKKGEGLRRQAPLQAENPDKIGMALAGYCIYAENYDYNNTLDEIEAGKVEIKWFDSYSYENDLMVRGGFLREGILYQVAEAWDFNPVSFELIQNISLSGLDPDSGERLSENFIPNDVAPIYNILTYNSSDDYIYGYGALPGYEGIVFMRTPFEDLSSSEMIASVEEDQASLYSLCWNPVENCLYGINEEKEFIKIEKDGKQTSLFTINIDYGSSYYGGLIYSVAEDCYYWNINFYDSSALAKIKPQTESVEIVFPFEYGNEFLYFLTTDSSNPDSPDKASLVSSKFANGSTSGSLIFKAPEALNNGTSLPAGTLLGYDFKLDDVDYKTGEVKAGETFEIKMENLSEGFHNFRLVISYGELESSPLRIRTYIGIDTPNPPAEVTLSEEMVTWSKVDSSEHGGYVDYDDLEYKVYINDEFYGSTKNLSLPVRLPADKELALYTASVSCQSQGKESEPTMSNMIAFGKPFSVPYYITPTLEQALLSYVWDSNNDDVSWTLINDGPFYISYSQTDQPHDDWLVLPPVSLTDTESYYCLSFEASRITDAYPLEYIEVALSGSPNPQDMNNMIVEKYQPVKNYPETNTVTALIKIDHPGTYYLGFHAISEPDQAGMTVGNVEIYDNNIRSESPQMAEIISCQAGEQGKLEAKLSFKFPSLSMNGTSLKADEKLIAHISSPSDDREIVGKPGEKTEVIVATQQGENEITLEVSSGELNSPKKLISIYTGIVPPLTPKQVSTVTHPDNTSMTITWDKVTKGENNGFLRPENVVYDVFRSINMGYYIDYQQLAEGLTETSYTYTLPYADSGEFLPQENVTLAVAARNEGGTNGRMAAFWDVLGTPYAIPFEEDLINWNFESFGWYMYAPSENATAEWVIDLIDSFDPSWGDPYHGILVCRGEKGTIGMLGMPRITTADVEHAALSINMYTGKNAPEVKILASAYGSPTPVEIGKFKPGTKEGMNMVEFPIPDKFMNKDWIQIYIQPEFSSASQIFAATGFFVNKTSGVNAVSTDMNLIIHNDGISVKAGVGEIITVFDLSGRKIFERSSDGAMTEISLEKGIYVVKAGSKADKVMIQ